MVCVQFGVFYIDIHMPGKWGVHWVNCAAREKTWSNFGYVVLEFPVWQTVNGENGRKWGNRYSCCRSESEGGSSKPWVEKWKIPFGSNVVRRKSNNERPRSMPIIRFWAEQTRNRNTEKSERVQNHRKWIVDIMSSTGTKCQGMGKIHRTNSNATMNMCASVYQLLCIACIGSSDRWSMLISLVRKHSSPWAGEFRFSVNKSERKVLPTVLWPWNYCIHWPFRWLCVLSAVLAYGRSLDHRGEWFVWRILRLHRSFGTFSREMHRVFTKFAERRPYWPHFWLIVMLVHPVARVCVCVF